MHHLSRVYRFLYDLLVIVTRFLHFDLTRKPHVESSDHDKKTRHRVIVAAIYHRMMYHYNPFYRSIFDHYLSNIPSLFRVSRVKRRLNTDPMVVNNPIDLLVDIELGRLSCIDDVDNDDEPVTIPKKKKEPSPLTVLVLLVVIAIATLAVVSAPLPLPSPLRVLLQSSSTASSLNWKRNRRDVKEVSARDGNYEKKNEESDVLLPVQSTTVSPTHAPPPPPPPPPVQPFRVSRGTQKTDEPDLPIPVHIAPASAPPTAPTIVQPIPTSQTPVPPTPVQPTPTPTPTPVQSSVAALVDIIIVELIMAVAMGMAMAMAMEPALLVYNYNFGDNIEREILPVVLQSPPPPPPISSSSTTPSSPSTPPMHAYQFQRSINCRMLPSIAEHGEQEPPTSLNNNASIAGDIEDDFAANNDYDDDDDSNSNSNEDIDEQEPSPVSMSPPPVIPPVLPLLRRSPRLALLPRVSYVGMC